MTKKVAEKKPDVVIVNRYSSEKLSMFKENIEERIKKTKVQMVADLEDVRGGNPNSTDDTKSSYNDLEDGKLTLSKKEAQSRYERGAAYLPLLNNALIRVKNGTYGICFETGNYIPESRLMSFPHTTRSIEGKIIQEERKNPKPQPR